MWCERNIWHIQGTNCKEEPRLPFLRLGKPDRMHPDIAPYARATAVAGMRTVSAVADLDAASHVVAGTCQGLCSGAVGRRMFDICIVDEASQCHQVGFSRVFPLFRHLMCRPCVWGHCDVLGALCLWGTITSCRRWSSTPRLAASAWMSVYSSGSATLIPK